jgi:predicted PP-loop superfamily ATPase
MEALMFDQWEEEQQEQKFTIDNDEKAEWALKKIAQEQKKANEIIDNAQFQIEQYQAIVDRENKRLEERKDFFTSMLNEYFQKLAKSGQVDEMKSKLRKRLPSGELALTLPRPKINYMEDAIVWMQENRPELIRTKYEINKADANKRFAIDNDTVIDSDTGEVIPVASVEYGFAEFKVTLS